MFRMINSKGCLGELIDAIYPENGDFGTTKGLAFSLDITRLSYFSISANIHSQ